MRLTAEDVAVALRDAVERSSGGLVPHQAIADALNERLDPRLDRPAVSAAAGRRLN